MEPSFSLKEKYRKAYMRKLLFEYERGEKDFKKQMEDTIATIRFFRDRIVALANQTYKVGDWEDGWIELRSLPDYITTEEDAVYHSRHYMTITPHTTEDNRICGTAYMKLHERGGRWFAYIWVIDIELPSPHADKSGEG